MEGWRFYFKSLVSVCRERGAGGKSLWRASGNTRLKKSGEIKAGRSNAALDYNHYIFSKEERIRYLLTGSLLFFSISYLFYENVLVSFLVTPLSIFYLKKKKQQKIKERKWQLNLQFREGLTALLGALNAGYSIENAFVSARKDLRLLYGTEEMIVQEFDGIVSGLQVNQNLEALLLDFAKRSQVEDIEMFAEVFSIGKRSGGNLIFILSAAMENVEDKIEVKRQISTVIASKRLEAKIMSFVPLGIIAYMKVFSGGLLEPLYHNLFGILVMTVLLAAYFAAYEMAGRIVEIEM